MLLGLNPDTNTGILQPVVMKWRSVLNFSKVILFLSINAQIIIMIKNTTVWL